MKPCAATDVVAVRLRRTFRHGFHERILRRLTIKGCIAVFRVFYSGRRRTQVQAEYGRALRKSWHSVPGRPFRPIAPPLRASVRVGMDGKTDEGQSSGFSETGQLTLFPLDYGHRSIA
jgi:hypothetical protein